MAEVYTVLLLCDEKFQEEIVFPLVGRSITIKIKQSQHNSVRNSEEIYFPKREENEVLATA